MKEIIGGKIVVNSLVEEGVNTVFGLIGSAGMEIFDGLYDAKPINFIGVRDERTGTHMADGYARASGKAGVFIAGQNGPGVTNLVTGLAQAKAALSPVVAIAGSLSSAHQYRDAFQEVDQTSLLSTVTKRSVLVPSTDRISELMRDGFRTATTPKQGPVAINIPRDVLSKSVEQVGEYRPKGREFDYICAASAASVDHARKIIANAKSPLILVGGGVKNGRQSKLVEKLATLLYAPVAMSPGHGDAVSCDFDLYAGQVGPRGNTVASNLMKTADVILAIGTRIGFNTTFYSYDNINSSAKIIQVELDPLAIGRFFPVELGIYADSGEFISSLIDSLSGYDPSSAVKSWTNDFLAKRKQFLADREGYESSSLLIQPAQLYRSIRHLAPKDAAYTMDAGTLCLQATDNLNYAQPPSLFTPLDFGLVGFSYACGLGVKLACPERTVISLMGDGGFGMTSSELGTAAQYQIKSICIVMNNGCWGAEKAYQKDFFGKRYMGADVPNPPYDKLAELWGVKGYRASSIKEFEDVFAAALSADAPAVIDVSVDPDALFSFRRDSFAHRAK
ncbi:thiamine pyrophosphate-binding protein [Polynucleobacter sinensis]|uniref:thiamine pyrophosphate-binding protein n=1 Tax=Polynucleobacter sinensis TaxID=1743157 RepID=UPI0007857C14|nr:thiamine pyrophosphate-binding protein [Polynucleobacter sinensis]